jgi:hypothetical protein
MKKITKLFNYIKSFIFDVRIILSSWIMGINKYQMSYALNKLVEAPQYVSEKPKKSKKNKKHKNNF